MTLGKFVCEGCRQVIYAIPTAQVYCGRCKKRTGRLRQMKRDDRDNHPKSVEGSAADKGA